MTPGRDRLWVLLGRVADEHVLMLRSNQMVTVLRRDPVHSPKWDNYINPPP